MFAFPFPTDLGLFVAWLGSPLAVGIIVSMLLEKQSWWQIAPSWLPDIIKRNWPRVKRVATFILQAGLPSLAAWIVGVVPPPYWTQGQIYLNFALLGAVEWVGGDLFHAVNPTRKKLYG